MSTLPFYTKALRLNTNNVLTYGKFTLHSHLKCYTFSLWEITQYMPSQNMTHYYSDQVCVSVKRASLVSELEISEKAILVIIIAFYLLSLPCYLHHKAGSYSNVRKNRILILLLDFEIEFK